MNFFVWDLKTRKVLRKLNVEGSALLITADSRKVITGGFKYYNLYELESGSLVKQIEKKTTSKTQAVLPKINLINIAGYFYEANTLAEKPYSALNGTIIYNETKNEVVRLVYNTATNYNADTFQKTGSDEEEYIGEIQAVSHNGQFIVSKNRLESIIHVYDINTNENILSYDVTPSDGSSVLFANVNFTNDNKTLLIGDATGTITFVNIEDGSSEKIEHAHAEDITELLTTSDDKYLISKAGNEYKMWLMESKRFVDTFGTGLPVGTGVFVSADQSYFGFTNGRYLNKFKTATLSPVKSLKITDRLIHKIQSVPEEEKVIVSDEIISEYKRGGALTSIYEVDLKKETTRLVFNHPDRVRTFDYVPEINTLYSVDYWKNLYTYNFNSSNSELKSITKLDGDILLGKSGFLFNPHKKEFFTGENGLSAFVFDETGQKIKEIGKPGGTIVKSIAYSSDYKYLITQPNSGDVTIFNASDYSVLGQVKNGKRQSLGFLRISHNDKYFLSGTGDPSVDSYHIAERSIPGGALSNIYLMDGGISDVSYFPDDERILAISHDGILYHWMNGEKEPIFKTYTTNNNGFIHLTDDYYYYASKDAYDILHFVNGDQIFKFDQFDLYYNRPDKIIQLFGFASPEIINVYKRSWEKRVRKMGFDPADFENGIQLKVPELELDKTIGLFEETSIPTYTYSVTASDETYQLERLMVEVNGVPVYGVRGKDISRASSKTTAQTIELTLSSGKNVITTSVLNERGVESLAARFEVTYTPATAVKPTLHVIAIGVSDFEQSEFNLTYADKDANDLIAAIKNSKLDFGEIIVHALTNEQATKENVLALRQELEQTKVDDQVIVFAATHGLLDDNLDYYLAMHGTDFTNPSDGGLRYDEIEQLIDGIPARNKLMLLDACHSGEVDKEETELGGAIAMSNGTVNSRGFRLVRPKRENEIDLKSSFELMKELFADLRRNNGAAVISSASGQEFAFESSEWKNGVFTYSLLEGLKSGNADLDKNGTVVVSELRDYVSQRVQELTNGQQNPTSRAVNLENDFKVW